MICPFCAKDEQGVIRTEKYDDHIIRYRKCKKCLRSYQTIEQRQSIKCSCGAKYWVRYGARFGVYENVRYRTCIKCNSKPFKTIEKVLLSSFDEPMGEIKEFYENM